MRSVRRSCQQALLLTSLIPKMRSYIYQLTLIIPLLSPINSNLLRGKASRVSENKHEETLTSSASYRLASGPREGVGTTQYVAAVAQHESVGSTSDLPPAGVIAANLAEYEAVLAESTA